PLILAVSTISAAAAALLLIPPLVAIIAYLALGNRKRPRVPPRPVLIGTAADAWKETAAAREDERRRDLLAWLSAVGVYLLFLSLFRERATLLMGQTEYFRGLMSWQWEAARWFAPEDHVWLSGIF